MSASSNKDREQGKTAHGQSLAQKLRWLHVLAFVAACSDVEPLIVPPRDPNDVDADDVPNALDNCPERYNDDQHDEDGDGFGDVCDVCPTVIDDQGDFGEQGALGLGDGIGDACDPRSTRDGDVLQRIDTFKVDTTEKWVGFGWAIGGDVARTTADARWSNPFDLQGDGLRAEIHVPLLIWLSGGYVEVDVNGDGLDAGATCVIRHTGDKFDQLIATEIGGATKAMQISPVVAPFSLIAWRTIQLDRSTTLRCILGNITLEMPLANQVPQGTFAFASSGAITDVGSIVVYTFPVNPCLSVSPNEGATPRICDNDPFD